MSLTTSQSEAASYESLKKKLKGIEDGNYRRIGKVLSYYCVLSEMYPPVFCVVTQSYDRCAVFEEAGPGEEIPKNIPAHVKACRCYRVKNKYACPLYLRFSQIYNDVMEDVNSGNKGRKED